MSVSEWDDSYSVGIGAIDEQHQYLFSVFYNLLEVNGIPEKTHEIVSALEGLKDYTHYHFADEEKYMEACNYPDIEEHKRIHRAFCEKVATICQDEAVRRGENLTEILNFLYNWLVDHICSCDQLYKPYVTGQVNQPVSNG